MRITVFGRVQFSKKNPHMAVYWSHGSSLFTWGDGNNCDIYLLKLT
jgi:hypothetical protein